MAAMRWMVVLHTLMCGSDSSEAYADRRAEKGGREGAIGACPRVGPGR